MSNLTTYKASEARNKFADIFNEAHYRGPVLIDKHGKKVAVVPMELLDRLAELEALIDIDHAQKSLAEFQSLGGKTMKELQEELANDS